MCYFTLYLHSLLFCHQTWFVGVYFFSSATHLNVEFFAYGKCMGFEQLCWEFYFGGNMVVVLHIYDPIKKKKKM